MKLLHKLEIVGSIFAMALAAWYADRTPVTHLLPRGKAVVITGCDTGVKVVKSLVFLQKKLLILTHPTDKSAYRLMIMLFLLRLRV